MHYYPHHIGDYRRDTAHLSILEHGAYRLLLDEYYVSARPLPSDLPTLCRITRALSRAERDAVAHILRTYFQPTPEGYRHKRVEAELTAYQAKADQTAQAGRASGIARRTRSPKFTNDAPTDVPTDTSTFVRTNVATETPTIVRTNQEPGTNNQLRSHPGVNSPRPRPTLAQARSQAPSLGLTPDEAETWWNAREASGWTRSSNGSTTPVGNWQADLKTYTHSSRQRQHDRQQAATARTRHRLPPHPRHPAYITAAATTDHTPQDIGEFCPDQR